MIEILILGLYQKRMPYVKLLNGIDTIHQDHDLSSYYDALADGGVYEGLDVSIDDGNIVITPGRAIVECHRSSGEKIMTLFVLEEQQKIPVSDGTLIIQIKQDNIDNKYLNNETGEGIGSIVLVPSVPDHNAVVLGLVSDGSIDVGSRQSVAIPGDKIKSLPLSKLVNESGDPVNVATEEGVAQSLAEAGSVSYLSAKRELGEDFPDIVETSTKETKGLSVSFGDKSGIYPYKRVFSIQKIGNPSELVVKKGTLENTTHHEIGRQGRTMELDNVIGKITIGTELNGGANSARYTKIIDRNTNEVIKQRDDIGETYEYTFNEPRNIKIVLTHRSYYISFIHYNTFDGLDYSLGIGENDEGQSGDIYLFSAETSDADNYYSIEEQYTHYKIVGYFLGRGTEHITVAETNQETVGKTSQNTILKLKSNEERYCKVSFTINKTGSPNDELSLFTTSYHIYPDQINAHYWDGNFHTIKNIQNAIGKITCEVKSSSTSNFKIIEQGTNTTLYETNFSGDWRTITYNLNSVKSIRIQIRGYNMSTNVKNISCHTKNDHKIELTEGENTIYVNSDMILLEATGISSTNYRSLHSSDGFLSGEYTLGYELDKKYLSNPDIPSRCSVDGLSYTGGKEGDISLGVEGGIRKHGLPQPIIGKVYVKSDGTIDTSEATKLYVGEGLGSAIRINNKIITTGETTTTATTGSVALGNAEGYVTVIINGEQKKIPYYGV